MALQFTSLIKNYFDLICFKKLHLFPVSLTINTLVLCHTSLKLKVTYTLALVLVPVKLNYFAKLQTRVEWKWKFDPKMSNKHSFGNFGCTQYPVKAHMITVDTFSWYSSQLSNLQVYNISNLLDTEAQVSRSMVSGNWC